MKANELRTDQVVASRKVGELNVDKSLVGDEVVNTPLAAGEAVFLELDPDITLAVGLSRGNVDHDGTLVGRGDGFVAVRGVGALVVVPLEAELRSSSNLESIGGLGATVADHGLGGDIEDGVVAIGGSLDSLATLVLSVKDDALEGGVSSGKLASSESESNGGLHFDVDGLMG